MARSKAPLLECEGCDKTEPIPDPTDMPPLYCPHCGSRRHVRLDPQNPENTKSDKV